MTEPQTTTQAVDTAANDLRKDVENDVKAAEPGIWARIKAANAWVGAKIVAAFAWIKSKI